MNPDKIVKALRKAVFQRSFASQTVKISADIATAAADLIESLQAQLEQQSNEPLTLDELRGMDGDPVWVEYTDDEGGKHAGWHVVDIANDNITLETIAGESTLLYVMVNGRDMMYRVSAYRRPPERSEDDV